MGHVEGQELVLDLLLGIGMLEVAVWAILDPPYSLGFNLDVFAPGSLL